MYTLRDLIRASGYAGTSGQSFRNHVAGAASGAKMSDYKCNGWAGFSGEPASDVNYSEGQGFAVSVDFSQGLRADYIKRLGNMIVITAGLSPDGFSVYNATSNVVGPASGSALSFNVHAPYYSGVTFTATKWFVGYVSPAEPSNGDPADVRFQAVVQAETPVGTQEVGVHIAYQPDIGPFNPLLTHDFVFHMNNRSANTDPAAYQWEWYTEADWNTYGYDGVHVFSTATSFLIQSNPQETHTYYLRAKMPADSVWTNVGAVVFFDDRSVA